MQSLMYNLLMGKAIRKSFFRLALLVSVLMSVFTALCAEPAKTVDAWRTTVDKSAAERAHVAYTSNVVRCEWAGENPRIAPLMPANVAFNFSVIGDSNSASRVTKTLEETAEAIDPALRKTLEQHGLLDSTLQWLVRSCRPGITNAATYLNANAHPAAFREQDSTRRRSRPRREASPGRVSRCRCASRSIISTIRFPSAGQSRQLTIQTPCRRRRSRCLSESA